MDETNNQSRWAILWLPGTFVCLFLAWFAGMMILDWHADRGDGGGVISLSAISSFGLLIICGSLILVGLTFAALGIFAGFRWASVVAIALHLWLVVYLVHGPERANERYRENYARSYPPPAPSPPPRMPAPAEYLRPHESLSGVALTRERVITMGFSPPTSPTGSGDNIHFWNLNDGSLVASFPRPASSTVTLLKDGLAYEEKKQEMFLHRFEVDERVGPFRRPPGHDRVLGVFANRVVVRITVDERRIQLWDLPSSAEVASFTNREPFACHALSSDNRKLAFVSKNEAVLRVVDCLTTKTQSIPFDKFAVVAARFSEDGQHLVLLGEAPQVTAKPTGRGAIPVARMASARDRYFAAGTQVTVFDLGQQTNIVFVSPELKLSSRPLFLSADGGYAILGRPQSFSILDLGTSPPAVREESGFERLCTSANGRFIVTYLSHPHRIRFWDGKTGEKLAEKTLQPIDGPVAHHIEFAPDNETVVVLRGGMVELCRASTDGNSFLLVDSAYTNAINFRASR